MARRVAGTGVHRVGAHANPNQAIAVFTCGLEQVFVMFLHRNNDVAGEGHAGPTGEAPRDAAECALNCDLATDLCQAIRTSVGSRIGAGEAHRKNWFLSARSVSQIFRGDDRPPSGVA